MPVFRPFIGLFLTGALLLSWSARAEEAPDFSLRNLNGHMEMLSDYRGEVIVLSFWSSCCSGSVQQLRVVQDLFVELSDSGLIVLAVSMDDARYISKVTPFVRKHGLTMPVLLDQGSKVVIAYNPTKIKPFTVVIDRNHQVLEKIAGMDEEQAAALEQLVRTLVKTPVTVQTP
jgi:peroxiredoxin